MRNGQGSHGQTNPYVVFLLFMRMVAEYVQERIPSQPENPFAALVPDQQIAVIPSFTLESGVVLRNVPLAYTARGTLNAAADNVMVVCHALTGSADVSDWWGPLLGGPGKALDTSRFFVICMNCLGSPYGSASPVTAKDGDAALGHYGPEFPRTTIRDDIRLHKLLLDELGVRQVAAVIGGSLGGMFALEWAYLGKRYVRCVIPIATSSRHSAWGISWGEAQRQSVYADPKYRDGYYPISDQPTTGLCAARMAALLTYRSPSSFDSRFGRQVPDPARHANMRDQPLPTSRSEAHFHIHNDGHKWSKKAHKTTAEGKSADGLASSETCSQIVTPLAPSTPDPEFHGPTALAAQQWQQMSLLPQTPPVSTSSSGLTGGDMLPAGPTCFSVQSYLRYQGQKFIARFDSNCYIAMTRKLDTHDVSRGRAASIPDALAMIEQPTLILGIESDGLFTFPEQEELARYIPNARLERIISPEGHDAFLLQFEQVNRFALRFLREMLPDMMSRPGSDDAGGKGDVYSVGKLSKTSTFGEAEVDDITAW